MNLFKVSIWSFLIILTSTVVGFINQKLYAIYTGSEGLLAIGNFNNFSSIVYIIASGGIYGGIVKVTADNYNLKNKNLFKIIYSILFYYAVLTAIFLLIFNEVVFKIFFKHLGVGEFSVYLFYFTLPLIILSNGLLYVLNGKSQIIKYSLSVIIVQLLNFVITLLLVRYYFINGAILSLYLPNVVGFLFMLIIANEYFVFPSFNIKAILKNKIYKTLLLFSVVSIISIFFLSISQLFIRDLIVRSISITDASYWQVLNNFSKIWMAVFSGIITMYFYPKISSFKDLSHIKLEIREILKIGIPIIFLIFLIVYVIKDFLVTIVYTEKFKEATSYFIYQLIGDFFKVISLVYAYVFMAREKLTLYIITELFFYTTYVLLSYVLVNFYNLKGIFWSYILSYFMYLLVQYILLHKSFKLANEHTSSGRF